MIKIFNYTILLLFCCTAMVTANAQDPHFSQYFSSPLTFNPAFTGYFDGTHRITVNLRNQWVNISDPYTTGTASFDTKIWKNKIGSNDRWGVGVHALYDQSSGGIFKNSYISFSTGFNKGLDESGDQSIGIGVQATFARSSIDFSRISFNNQYTTGGFDLSVPSGETFNNRSANYVDLNAGILYNYKDENDNQFSFGASIFHLLRPKLAFYSSVNNTLQQRYTVHAGANLPIGEKDVLFISTHLMAQAGNTEIVGGGAYGIGLPQESTNLYFGAWIRAKDAIYPYLGLRTPSYQLGFTYDVTNSDLKKSAGFTGSSELSLIFFFNGARSNAIPCFF